MKEFIFYLALVLCSKFDYLKEFFELMIKFLNFEYLVIIFEID